MPTVGCEQPCQARAQAHFIVVHSTGVKKGPAACALSPLPICSQLDCSPAIAAEMVPQSVRDPAALQVDATPLIEYRHIVMSSRPRLTA